MRIGSDGAGADCGMIDDPDSAPELAIRGSPVPPSEPGVAVYGLSGDSYAP
jgi:hypothetical protein